MKRDVHKDPDATIAVSVRDYANEYAIQLEAYQRELDHDEHLSEKTELHLRRIDDILHEASLLESPHRETLLVRRLLWETGSSTESTHEI